MQSDTHVAVVVQQVVGEFEFIKRDDLLHPLGAFGRRVRVIVDPARRGGVSFTGNQPRGAVEGVPGRETSPLLWICMALFVDPLIYLCVCHYSITKIV